ncbi:MAG: prolipoprotein diacylglyceryl transferase [Clostridia bacterium]|nr:prolipoprotein diacylglyceryl transferase [Clostridia bacterium]
MPESITLFGHEVPVYGLCYFAGIFLAAGAALLICKKRGVQRYDMVYATVYAMLAAVVGAKLLFIAVSFRQIVEQHIPLVAVLKGGFVFYGGLIGGVLGMLIYCKQFKLPFWDFADVAAVVVPLGHAVGRVGCFAAGCCYGVEYHGPFSHTYTHLQNTSSTPLGVPLLPVQLIESALLLLLFAGLLIGFLRHPNAQKVFVAVYVLAYSAIRFTLEFFRGDGVRGVFFGLSTSQWISLAAAVLVILWLIFRRKPSTLSE